MLLDVDDVKSYLLNFIDSDLLELEVYYTKRFPKDPVLNILNIRITTEIKGKEVFLTAAMTDDELSQFSQRIHEILKYELLHMVTCISDCFLVKSRKIH